MNALRVWPSLVALVLVPPLLAAQQADTVDPSCAIPVEPTIVLRDGDAVLLTWEFPAAAVHEQYVLPDDSAFLAFRAAVRAEGAAVRRPVAGRETAATEAEAENWRKEDRNHELAQSGEVGSIDPITCLDALLFAHQNRRVPQLEQPTEFLASVLRRGGEGDAEVAVVFGAGREMFPPKSVYGFDVVDRYTSDGWTWWYALHNHTLQRDGDRLALGSPTLSTSDVQLTRNLAADGGLENARVTNGFYTFRVAADELARLESR